MKKILVVDDDPNICELISLYFEKEGFHVQCCYDGESALETLESFDANAIILDLMLPERDGYDVCREVRKTSQTPIIMLTARSETLDKVVGLELGADDYVPKPFDPKELIARVKAVLRRSEPSPQRQEKAEDMEQVSCYDLVVDKAQYIVTYRNTKVDMPPKELELLFFLVGHPNRVFSREQLLGQVWGYDFYGESRTVDVHIKRLREKLDIIGDHAGWDIKTVWGVGYKLEVEEK